MDFVALTDIVADFSKTVAERARAFPEFARELHLFDEQWVETIGGPIEENVALLRRLKAAGRPVYALSNFASVKFAIARRMFDFLNEFDLCVISGHVGVVKPDPRIYEILIERAGRNPGELLFVDDSLANVRAAEAAGMGAIHYAPGVDLEHELRLRGRAPRVSRGEPRFGDQQRLSRPGSELSSRSSPRPPSQTATGAEDPSDRSRRDERAIEVDILEYVGRHGADRSLSVAER